MPKNARDEILERLKAAPKGDAPTRPKVPPLHELSWNREQMIEKFTENLTHETSVVYRVENHEEAADKLTEIVQSENLNNVIVSADEVIASLQLQAWGKKNNVAIFASEKVKNHTEYKHVVFEKVDAGITGVDYAVAESGTLVLVHDRNQPRMASLAPLTHIAIVPVERLVATYEEVTDQVFKNNDALPAHVTFITGPSMTADIQGVPFKGMHGPKKLFVVIVG